MGESTNARFETDGNLGSVPKPFGHASMQRLGALLIYIAALFPLSGWIVQALAGPNNLYVYNSVVMLFVVFIVAPVLAMTIVAGVILYVIGSIVWVFKHRFRGAKSALVTKLGSIPPIVVVAETLTYAAMLTSGTFTLGTDTFTGSLWWSVDVYFKIYVAIAVVGVVLEIYSGLRNKRKT